MTGSAMHRAALVPAASSDDLATRPTPGGWLPSGLITLAVGLAANSIVGPLWLDLVDYPLTETLRNQTVGLDAVTLFVVAPTALAASSLIRRGHPVGPILAVVAGTYTAYMFLQFVVGPDYDHYPGTLPLQLGLFVLGWTTGWSGWRAAAHADLPPMSRRTRTRHAIVAASLAGFVVLRYLPGVAAALNSESIPEESLGDPAMFWSILLMDVGIFVPLVAATAIALRRGSAAGLRGLYAAVGWFVLVTLAVLTMAIVMVANHDPNGAGAQVAVFALTAVAVLTYAVRLFHPLHHRRRENV